MVSPKIEILEDQSIKELLRQNLSKEALIFLETPKKPSQIEGYVALLEILSVFFHKQKEQQTLELREELKKEIEKEILEKSAQGVKETKDLVSPQEVKPNVWRKNTSLEDDLSFIFNKIFPLLDKANPNLSPYICPYLKDRNMELVLKIENLQNRHLDLINQLAKVLNISQNSIITTIIMAWFHNLGIE